MERVFSLVTAVKTKPRNALELKTLDAIVRIRSTLMLDGKCCVDFIPTRRMMELFKADVVYGTDPSGSDDLANFI